MSCGESIPMIPDDETGDYGLVGSLPSGIPSPSAIGYGMIPDGNDDTASSS